MSSKNRIKVETSGVLDDDETPSGIVSIFPEIVDDAVTEADEQRFLKVISTDLTEEQASQILTPPQVYNREKELIALHWHPEFIPMPLIKRRIETMFPNIENSLIIPTQHNEFLSYDDVYSGVEIDCLSRGFNQKVQLLLHMKKERAEKATILKSMAEYTFKYRSSQLFDLIESFTKPVESRIIAAARATGVNQKLIDFVRLTVKKIYELIDKYHDDIPPLMFKNKLLRNYFDSLRDQNSDVIIDRAQAFIKAVKVEVKKEFPLTYFYRTSEVIEEARAIGAGIVVPHPEQFWPILLANYDVDGIEIWNPQSRKYTDFLISVINEKNNTGRQGRRRLLVLMGDDTHMGEKTKAPSQQKDEKALREIGVQPGWDDLLIKKKLILAGMERKDVIREYRSRLG